MDLKRLNTSKSIPSQIIQSRGTWEEALTNRRLMLPLSLPVTVRSGYVCVRAVMRIAVIATALVESQKSFRLNKVQQPYLIARAVYRKAPGQRGTAINPMTLETS